MTESDALVILVVTCLWWAVILVGYGVWLWQDWRRSDRVDARLSALQDTLDRVSQRNTP